MYFISVLFIICTCATTFYDVQGLNPTIPYHAQELCQDADARTANLILNFLYWSYRRASATITLQDAFYRHITHDLQQLEGFHRLRHNPERSLSESTCKAAEPAPMTCAEYEAISHSYVTCCKTVLADTAPLSSDIRARLETIRSHVRGEISAIVATSLAETYHVLASVHTGIQTLYTNFGHLLFKNPLPKPLPSRDGSFFSAMWSYMPSFVINVTYQFEDKHLELRKHLCNVLTEDMRISDELWREIEQIRVYTYKTLYTECYYHLARSMRDDARVFTMQFTSDDANAFLPHPSELACT